MFPLVHVGEITRQAFHINSAGHQIITHAQMHMLANGVYFSLISIFKPHLWRFATQRQHSAVPDFNQTCSPEKRLIQQIPVVAAKGIRY